jgi:predicted DNA-binding protein
MVYTRAMKRISMWMPETQLKQLKVLSKSTGLKVAELVRRFIHEGLTKSRKWKR